MASTDNLMLGGGELFFAKKKSDGSFDDFRYFGLTDSLSVNLSTDTLEHINTEGDTPTTDMELEKKKTITMSVETSEISQAMIARFFKGSEDTVTQVAGTVTAEAHTVSPGGIYNLSKIKVSSVVVKSAGGGTTYAEGTDYAVKDAEAGVIEILSGGAISDGTAVEIDFSYADATYTIVQAGTQTAIEGKLKFISAPAVGPKREWNFHKISIIPSGDMALKAADDWAKASFEIKVLKDDTITSGSQFFSVKEIPAA